MKMIEIRGSICLQSLEDAYQEASVAEYEPFRILCAPNTARRVRRWFAAGGATSYVASRCAVEQVGTMPEGRLVFESAKRMSCLLIE